MDTTFPENIPIACKTQRVPLRTADTVLPELICRKKVARIQRRGRFQHCRSKHCFRTRLSDPQKFPSEKCSHLKIATSKVYFQTPNSSKISTLEYTLHSDRSKA